MENKTLDICFVIMPYGGWFDRYYSEIYSPAIVKGGFIPRRADDLYRPSAIIHDIWTLTNECQLVLADLTNKNPNVLYELGLAHAIAKPVVLITERIEDVPFDLRSLRVIEYNKNSPDWSIQLGESISKAIIEISDSPLSSVLPIFQVNQPIEHNANIIQEQPDIDIGMLKNEVDSLRREIYEIRSNSSLDESKEYPAPIINESEATDLVHLYVRKNIPKEHIMHMLLKQGIPATWTFNAIDKATMEIKLGDEKG